MGKKRIIGEGGKKVGGVICGALKALARTENSLKTTTTI